MARQAIVLAGLLLGSTPAWSWPGDLDPSFGRGGKVLTDLGGDEEANAAALQPDGRIVAAGSGQSGRRFLVVRYNGDGTLDSNFGSGGYVLTQVGPFGDRGVASALVRQEDGKLVAAGAAGGDQLGESQFALVRYDTTGALDPSFGTGGTVTTMFAADASANAVVIQPDGFIVAVGALTYSGGLNCDFALARYDASGNLDPGFGTGGTVVTDLGGCDVAHAVVLQPDGRILVAGSSGAFQFRVALARYAADGTLDPSFGTGGVVLTDFSADIRALALLPSGLILVAGGAVPSMFNGYDRTGGFALLGYRPDGTLDPTFGIGGTATSRFGGSHTGGYTSDGYTDLARALAVQPDGMVVAAGEVLPGNEVSHFGLLRYAPDGSLDRTFAPCAGAVTVFGEFTVARASAVLIQPDGKLVAVGTSGFLNNGANGLDVDLALARYVGTGGPSACVPAVSRRASVRLRANYDKSSVQWSWTGAGLVDVADFGDPTAATDLFTCVMDATPNRPFVLGAAVPAGGTCPVPQTGRPCWQALHTGYGYNLGLYPDGLTRIRLVPGAAGKAKIKVSRVPQFYPDVLGFPALPLSPPVRVRLQRLDAARCWESTFSTPSRNDTTVFTAKSD